MKEFFKNRTVLGLGSIILALLLSFGVTPFMNKAMRSQVTIIRASKNIKKGEEITADKITKVKVGGYNLPQQVIKEQNELVGKYATADIYKDDYFLKYKVSDSIDDDNYLRDENMAISITIRSLAAGLSGKLKAGDIVSIISSSEDGIKPMIIPELQYVEVLSITSKEGKDIEGEKEELPSTINLSVDPIQAEKLVEQEQNGNIHLLLVYRGEEKVAKEYLGIQKEYLLSLEKAEEGETYGETEKFETTQVEEDEEIQEEGSEEREEQNQ